MKTKKPEFDWEQYESVPLAVLIHSSELGWMEVARYTDTNRPEAIKEARIKYEGYDGRKMLLNFGQIIAEETDPRAKGFSDRFKHVREAANRRDAADIQKRLDKDNDGWAQ